MFRVGSVKLENCSLPQQRCVNGWQKLTATVKPLKPSRRGIPPLFADPILPAGISDFHLEIIRPIIKKYQPTIGFSLEEARQAQRVSVIGGPAAFSEAAAEPVTRQWDRG